MVRRPPPLSNPATTRTAAMGPAAASTSLQPVPQRHPRPEPSRVVTLKRLLRKSGFSRGAAFPPFVAVFLSAGCGVLRSGFGSFSAGSS